MTTAVGRFKTRRISQSELASMAGVSRATVSRALAGHPAISEEVASRVHALARKHDYRPSAAARSFVTQRNNVLGMVICNRTFDLPVYAGLLAGVEEHVRSIGLKLQVSRCDASATADTQQLPPIFRDDGVDGVILTGDVPQTLLERLSNWQMPFVLLGSQPGLRGVNQVSGDAMRGGHLIAEHLLELGHRQIGILVGPRKRPLHRQYFEGFAGVLREAGIDNALIERRTQEAPNTDALADIAALFNREPDLTAVFCDTDLAAWQVVQFARARGVDVPGQLSVAGAGQVGRTLSTPLDLTGVDVQFPQLCKAAVTMLQDLLEDSGHQFRRMIIEPVLAEGATAGPLAQAKSDGVSGVRRPDDGCGVV